MSLFDLLKRGVHDVVTAPQAVARAVNPGPARTPAPQPARPNVVRTPAPGQLQVRQPQQPRIQLAPPRPIQPIQQPQIQAPRPVQKPLQVRVAAPQNLNVKTLIGTQQITPTPGMRSGVAAPTPIGNTGDVLAGFAAGGLSSAAKAAAATVHGATDIRFLTPHSWDANIKKGADTVTAPFKAVQKTVDSFANEKNLYGTQAGQRGRTIGNVSATAGVYGPQVIAGGADAINLAKALPGAVRTGKRLAQDTPKILKEATVGTKNPHPDLTPDDIGAVGRVHRGIAGYGDTTRPGDIQTYRSVQRQKGFTENDHGSMENLLNQMNDFDVNGKQGVMQKLAPLHQQQGGYARIPGGKLDPAKDLHPEQKTFVNDYAEMLQGMDDTVAGGNKFKAETNGAPMMGGKSNFYSDHIAEHGTPPSKEAYFNEARQQIESGKGAFGASDDYKTLPTPKTTPKSQPKLPAAPALAMQQNPVRSLGKDTPINIKAPNNGSHVPVSKITTQGDRIIKTDVKTGSNKRFALDDRGDLVPDTKGAYHIFTDESGRVTQFRVGDEVFKAKDLGDLSTVNGVGKATLTMRRNVEAAFGRNSPTAEKVNKFLVDDQQTRATQMITRQVDLQKGMKQVADDLGISFSKGRHKAKQVSAAIQDYGEGKTSREQLIEKFGPDQANKITKADKWFRKNYDSMLDEMNTTLEQFGYTPVPKRKDYYTHFQEPGLWEKFGLKMQEIKDLSSPTLQDANPGAGRGKISNKLAGESEFMTPNKAFNKYALRREGDTRTADAFQAFERYMTPTLNNIYMTPSISRARVLAKAISQEADTVGKDANHTLVQMKEWANNLAGKSNRFDRPLVDSQAGQVYLKTAAFLGRRAGANTIVGNLATAALQPVVAAQAFGKFNPKNFMLAAMQEMGTAHKAGAAIRQSEFMGRRYANTSKVTDSALDKAADVANVPLKVVEQTTARITWNAAHNQAVSKGLKGKDAIRWADTEAEKTLAGRSIGERPEIFNSKAASPLTMYQLEVNNYWQQMGKEMTKGQAATTLVAAYAFNLGLQQLTGRQVGFNPIDAAVDSYRETQKEGKSKVDKTKAIGQRFAGEFVDNTPFVGPALNAALGDKGTKWLGPTSNAGRFGVGSPIGALTSTVKAGPVSVPINLIAPFGGGQIKKSVEGYQAVHSGKLTDKNGKTTVNIPQTPGNYAKAIAFGKNAVKEVNTYNSNNMQKKVDQIKVRNQTDSVARTQGRYLQTIGGKEIELTPKQNIAFEKAKVDKFKTLSDQYKKTDAYKNASEKDRKTKLDSLKSAVTSAQKRELAVETNIPLTKQASKSEQAILNGKLPSGTTKLVGGSDGIALNKKLDKTSQKVLTEYNSLDAATRTAKAARENDYEYKVAVAKYENDKANGKISPVQEIDRQKKLAKLEIGKDYSKEARDLFGHSKADVYAYVTTAKNGNKLAAELTKYDQALYDANLIKYATFGNGIAPKGGSKTAKTKNGAKYTTTGKSSKGTKTTKATSATRTSAGAIKATSISYSGTAKLPGNKLVKYKGGKNSRRGKVALRSYKLPSAPKVNKRKRILV